MNTQTPYNRPERVGHEILHILSDITTKYIDITHLGFITFTGCQVSPDLKQVKVFFSVLTPQKDITDIERELNHRKKAYRKYLGQQLRIKNTPEVRFYYDNSLQESHRINELIARIDDNHNDL